MGNGKFPLAMLMLALSAMSVGQDAMAQVAKPVTNGVELTKSESVLSMRVDGEMVVSPDGRVTEHRITTELPAEVLSLIDKNMAAWRFEPVKDQLGNPTHAKTYMRLTVVARKQGDGNYSALVENARFHDGEGRRGKSKSDKHALIDGKSGVRLLSKPRIDYPPIKMVQMTGDVYTAGIEEHLRDGVTLRVYGAAKTVVDCFKHRNKIGLDVALEALKDAWRMRKASADELWRYAQACRVANVMRPYMEAVAHG